MQSFLINFKQSYFIIPIVILFSIFITFLDSKLNKSSVERKNYFKIALLSAIISFFVVYVNNLSGSIEEEIISGPVPF